MVVKIELIVYVMELMKAYQQSSNKIDMIEHVVQRKLLAANHLISNTIYSLLKKIALFVNHFTNTFAEYGIRDTVFNN